MIYLIGSLRNPEVPKIANFLREQINHAIFDDWFAASENADDSWKDYELGRGHNYAQALKGHAGKHVFAFDRYHINRAHGGILMLPAGKSGHLEAGFLSATKPVFLLLENGQDPERIDVMSQFFNSVSKTKEELVDHVNAFPWPKIPQIQEISAEDAQWLAGLLEGEGSFCLSYKVPRLVLQMTDEDVVRRAANILGVKTWKGKTLKSGKQVWACASTGLQGIEHMRLLKYMLGSRRKRQINTTVEGWLNQRSYRKQDESYWRKVFGL